MRSETLNVKRFWATIILKFSVLGQVQWSSYDTSSYSSSSDIFPLPQYAQLENVRSETLNVKRFWAAIILKF